MLNKLKTSIEFLKKSWDYNTLLMRIAQLEENLNSSTIWENQENAIKLSKSLARLQDQYKILQSFLEILEIYTIEEPSQKEIDNLLKEVDTYRIKCLFSEEDDLECYIQIKAGAGGDEAKDWVLMLTRMYLRYAQIQGFSAKIVEEQMQNGKVECISIHCSNKEYLYGYLKYEKGIHRLVRTLASSRHTSFADIDVFPIIQNCNIEIASHEIEEINYKGSSPGGQHANTTETGVRLKHIVSGIVSQCNNQRSQNQNYKQALHFLKLKLYKQKLDQEQQEKKQRLAEKPSEMWGGNYVRSYVLDPYQKVKNYKTGYELSNVYEILDGEIHQLIEDLVYNKNS